MTNTFKGPLQKAVVTWLFTHPDISKRALAAKAEIDHGDISRICSGTKSSLNMESAGRLASAMGTTVEALLRGEATAMEPASAAPNGVRLAPSAGEPGAHHVPVDLIDPSPDNPRKHFDEEALGTLAASIREQGLLQPIVLRPVGERYEIIAGERRWRATRLNEAKTILAYVRDVDAETARALRIIENLQRQDIQPLEEADAFLALHQLDPEKWNATAIGKAVGMSDRFVAQRLAIARNLTPKLKERLAKGDLKVEIARVLAGWPQSLQSQVGIYDHTTAQTLRNHLESMVIPASRAAFNRKLYTGERIEEDGKEWFVDKEMFLKLQGDAAAARAEKLAKDWPDAKFLSFKELTKRYVWADDGDTIFNWRDKREAKTKKKGLTKTDVTAVVVIDDSGKLREHKGVVEKRTFEAKAVKSAAELQEERKIAAERSSAEGVDEARARFNAEVLDQSTNSPNHVELAKVLLIYAAIGRLGDVNIDHGAGEFMSPWQDQLKDIVEVVGGNWEIYQQPQKGENKLWAWLSEQPIEQIDQMFCRLMMHQLRLSRWSKLTDVHHFAFKALGVEIPQEIVAQQDEDEVDFDDDDDAGTDDGLGGDFDEDGADDAAEAA